MWRDIDWSKLNIGTAAIGIATIGTVAIGTTVIGNIGSRAASTAIVTCSDWIDISRAYDRD
jgi:hypothetical protein